MEKNINKLIESEDGWEKLWKTMSRDSCSKDKDDKDVEREIEEVDKRFILKGFII